jgi:thiol-disulfide isomerase/thioredoxin
MLVILSCAGVEDEIRIEGRVVGADGQVPPLAHVHLLELGADIQVTARSIAVGDDGSFQLAVPVDGYHELLATAVDHQAFRIPLLLDEVQSLEGIEIRPAPNQYEEPLADVRIIGPWINFSWQDAEPMTPRDDGTFVYERRADADTLAYQLLNARPGRSVNGTDADHFIYDGGGDYISVVRTEGEVARVVFDPEAGLPPSPDLPRVDGGPGSAALTQAAEISARMELATAELYAARDAHWHQHGTMDGFSHDTPALRQYLKDRMDGGSTSAIRRYAAVRLAGMVHQISEEERASIMEMVPVTDGIWAAEAQAMARFFREAVGRERMIEIFQAKADEITSPKLRAMALLEIGLYAKEACDSLRQREVYDELYADYMDVGIPWLRFAVEDLNPALLISHGKPLPDFEVELMGGGKRLSNRTMLGKYWLLDFWATWCGPCVGEMSGLHRAYESFKDADLEVLSISMDGSPDHVKEFRRGKWPMPWHHAFIEGGMESELARLFEVNGIPKPILVDPQGIVVAMEGQLRGENLQATLAEHLTHR